MDSLTHILLGAAIGEATLGKQAGKKAMLWGAVAATAPDADVLIGVFMSDLDKIMFHRGWTHSLFFILCISPVYGWLISKISKAEVNWKQWTLLVFLAQVTHTLLDTFTSYGTQIMLPFSSQAAAIGSISVLDPLFTLPLLVSVIILLVKSSDDKNRNRINAAGLSLCVLYLFLTLGNKLWVDHTFNSEWNRMGFQAEKAETKPTLLNNLLWRGIALIEDDTYAVGYYSNLDGRSEIIPEFIYGNHLLLEPYSHLESVQRLKWVSGGFYSVESTEDGFIFNDLRFGRVAEFSSDDTPYAFSYKLIYDDELQDFVVTRIDLSIDRQREGNSLRQLKHRIFGIDG